jgi:competence protein ComEA
MDRLLPWLRSTGWVYALLAIGLAALAWRVGDPRPEPAGAGGERGAATPAAPAAEGGAGGGPGPVVHVAGAVARPGVYELSSGDRVRDAVRRAGGPRRGADLGALNLAAQLQDGQQVVVPARGAGRAGEDTAGPVSLSSASAEDLEELDGIGPALAERIVEHRDALGGFASIEQLDEVPGIGPARLEALRDEVVP